jgi:hypothetical protein
VPANRRSKEKPKKKEIEMTDNLGAYNEDEYGSVDLFGLDEFGQPVGPYPAIGAALGTAIQTSAAIAVRRFTKKDKWSEGIGAGVGVMAGGAMMLLPKMRAMAWSTLAASLVGGGLRQLEVMMSKNEKAKQEAAEAAKEAESSGEQSGMGLVQIEPTEALGLPTIEPTQMLGMPPQLVGAGDYGLSQNPAAKQAQLVGPGVSGLGSHFGSTIFG